MLRLADKYGPARLEAACAEALTVGDPTYRTIKGLLASGLEADPRPRPPATAARQRSCTDPPSCSATPPEPPG